MSTNAKEISNRVELRDRIIVKATEAFTLHGIKSITMDDIATSLGISKRTLYEVFEDKETLLREVILKTRRIKMSFWKIFWLSQQMYWRLFWCVFKRALRCSIRLTNAFLRT